MQRGRGWSASDQRRLNPPPPPPRGLSCASFTFSGRPPKSRPFNDCIAFCARHFDEPEPARLTRVAIVDQRNLLDASVFGEQGADGVFGGGEGQISNIELHDEFQITDGPQGYPDGRFANAWR
jgi:hypothetical protein